MKIPIQIDFEESKLQNHICVKYQVDEVLDDKRRTYEGLPSLLTKIANNLSRDLSQDFAESISIVYFPQVGLHAVILKSTS